jgi:hypothetical protein
MNIMDNPGLKNPPHLAAAHQWDITPGAFFYPPVVDVASLAATWGCNSSFLHISYICIYIYYIIYIYNIYIYK